ncbi:MAG: penicillin-binding transpeptidase domain-containing protein [Rhodospirillales bacterium]
MQRLGSESGAVVLDIETGKVLAMASTPAYDPAAFNHELTNEEWKALTSDRRHR